MEFFKDLFVLLGRICISGMFLWGIVDRLMHWKGSTVDRKTQGIPYVNAMLPIAVILQIVGSLLIFFGYHAHLGALLLMIVLVPSSLKLHAFWNQQGPERAIEKHLFMKDIAIFGALLMIFAMGAGEWGISK